MTQERKRGRFDEAAEDYQLSIRCSKRKKLKLVDYSLHETSLDEDFSSGSDEDYKLHYSDDSFFSDLSHNSICSDEISDQSDNSSPHSGSCTSGISVQSSNYSSDSNSSNATHTIEPKTIKLNSCNESDAPLYFSNQIEPESINILQSNIPAHSQNSSLSIVNEEPSSTLQISEIPSRSQHKNTEIEYEFVAGKRRNSKLLFSFTESIFYKRNSKGAFGVSYVCYQEGCYARLLLRPDGVCLRKSGIHMHSTHEILYKQLEGENKIKELCLHDRSTKTTKEIYDEVLMRFQDLEKPYSIMQRNLRLLRSKGLPQSPQNCDEIDIAFAGSDIMDRFGFSKHQTKREKFFHGTFSNQSFAFCVFASLNTVKLIQENTKPEKLVILMDATFKVVPISCFSQLLIIYAEFCGKIYPITYILMSRKLQICYSAVLNYIEENICSLQCSTFITDYEKAMKNALRDKYPTVNLTSCWFHFCQAVRKKVSQIPELFEMIRKNKEAAYIYRQFQCIPLLPENEIKPTFNELKAIAENFNRRIFSTFLTYFKQQ